MKTNLKLDIYIYDTGSVDLYLWTSNDNGLIFTLYLSSIEYPAQSEAFQKELQKAIIKIKARDLSNLRQGLNALGDIADSQRYVPADIFTNVGSFLTGVTGTLDVQNAKLFEQNELVGGKMFRKKKSPRKSPRKAPRKSPKKSPQKSHRK